MVQSMTGVGKATTRYGSKTVTVFVKTLNSKQLDISTRIPAYFREREMDIRGQIAEALVRGKVELSITLDDATSDLSGVQRINAAAARHYIEEMHRVFPPICGAEVQLVESVLRLPGVLMPCESAQDEMGAEDWEALRATLAEALDAVQAFRRQEGCMLAEVLSKRIENISLLLAQIDLPERERIAQIRTRLEDALQKLGVEGIDRGRLEQELIYYIEKLDVSEEKDRLRHHLGYFAEVMTDPQGAQGKTLGFIAQEIGREINTLGSKSNHAQMQKLVVCMKDELEQIKEQCLNIL